MIDPKFTRKHWYDKKDVENIQTAYQSLFPRLTSELLAYWNFERKPRHRLLPYLTTNFHETSYAEIKALSDAAMEIEQTVFDVGERGARLIEVSRPGLGFSIGISPWTDHALHRTWDSEKGRLVIIIGHDWYPIASQNDDGWDQPSDVPLSHCGLHITPTYAYAIPRQILECSPVVLFLNLVPDYRLPGTSKTGRLRGYKDWLRGFDAVVRSIAGLDRFHDISILAWGAHTWEALQPCLSQGHGCRITKWIERASGQVLSYLCDGRKIPFFATVHPSFRPNWNTEHARQGYATLDLA